MLLDSALSALANVIVLGCMPLLVFALYHRWRNRAPLADALAWAGLQRGEARYFWICAAAALVVVAGLLLWPPPLGPLTREGSAAHRFAGVGLTPGSVTASLLYGVVQTGLSEELLFRGFLMTRLRRATGSWFIAVVVTSAVFTVLHAFEQTRGALITIAVLSVFFSVLTVWRRSIVPAMVAHALFDFSQFLFLQYSTTAPPPLPT